MEIKFVDWGLANNFGEVIELHRDLESSILLAPILEHELKHTNQEELLQKLLHDLVPSKTDVKYFRLKVAMFMLYRPKTWIQILPVYFHKGKGLVYDTSWIFFWMVILNLIFWGVKLI